MDYAQKLAVARHRQGRAAGLGDALCCDLQRRILFGYPGPSQHRVHRALADGLSAIYARQPRLRGEGQELALRHLCGDAIFLPRQSHNGAAFRGFVGQ